MADDDWKQSAVMFYAFGTILAMVIFISLFIYALYKNRDRRMKIQKILCWCCTRDVMQHYDTIQRTDDDVEVGDGLLDIDGQSAKFTITSDEEDEEIEIDIHGDDERPFDSLQHKAEIDMVNLGYKDNSAI